MSSNVLADRDINAAATQQPADAKLEFKSMDFQREILKKKMESQDDKAYISPSDNIQSPCTTKLNNYKGKYFMNKAKPRTLFANTSSKYLDASSSMSCEKTSEEGDQAMGGQ